MGSLTRCVAHLDFKSVNDYKFRVNIYCSQNVSINMSSIENSNKFFLKEYNNKLFPVLKQKITDNIFEEHIIEISFD